MRILMPDRPEFRALPLAGAELAFYPAGVIGSGSNTADQAGGRLPGGAFDGVVGWSMPASLRREALIRPGLKWALTLTAGIDGWQGEVPPGVTLYNASPLHGGAVAQHAAAALLSAGRGMIRFSQQREWERSGKLWTLAGRRVVLWGYGHIGRELERLITPFGAQVSGLRSSSTPEEVRQVLAGADDVVLLLPLTEATRQIVNAEVLGRLKPGAWLHNFGRGPLVDTAALIAALDSGHLGGAVLDVTDPEPLPPGHALWERRNVLITPHIASTTEDMEQRAAAYAARFIEQMRRGEEPEGRVELGKGY
jgi:phosphoglycerate dehydrogenase-like enzyme